MLCSVGESLKYSLEHKTLPGLFRQHTKYQERHFLLVAQKNGYISWIYQMCFCQMGNNTLQYKTNANPIIYVYIYIYGLDLKAPEKFL